MKRLLKKEKGITLTSLVIMVAVILILTGVTTYNAIDSMQTAKLNNLKTDIQNLRDKVSNYYAQYGMIPADTNIEYTNVNHINSIGANDTGVFYVIDLAAMENVTLNYGKDYEEIRKGIKQTQEEINNLTDLYIINSESHNIFYVEGLKIGDKMYYTDYTQDSADKVEVEIHIPEKLQAKDVTKDDYGAEVSGYECADGTGVEKWQIFYADNSNIYLIASDYISYEYLPSSTLGNNLELGIHSGAGYFTSILNDYTGSENISNQVIQKLNNSFFNQSLVSKNNNMKSVAYMLDTNAWKGFKGEKADYAIGGPTIELYLNSYNNKYGTNYVAKATSSIGYNIGSGTATATSLTLSVKDDLLYVTTDINKSSSMWIASPVANSTDNIFSIKNTGEIVNNKYDNNDSGFRPIICLNTNTQLRRNGENKFSVVE